MFDRIRMALGVSTSLAALGIRTQHLSRPWLRCCEQFALTKRLSATEAAVFIFYQVPPDFRPVRHPDERFCEWIRKGRLSPDALVFAQDEARRTGTY